MNYKIILASSAERELFKLQKSEIQKIALSIDSLQINPRPKGYKKLKGPEIVNVPIIPFSNLAMSCTKLGY